MAGGCCCLAGCYLYSYLIVRGSLVKLASGVANGEVIGVGTGGVKGFDESLAATPVGDLAGELSHCEVVFG